MFNIRNKFDRYVVAIILIILIPIWFNVVKVYNNKMGNYFTSFVISNEIDSQNKDYPLVFVVIPVRNKEANLPYFLSYLEQLSYPKSKLFLYIRADHSEDNSIDIIEDWLNEVGEFYYHIDAVLDRSETGYQEEKENYFTEENKNNVININENALEKARHLKVDYILFLSSDVYLINPNTVNNMILHRKTVAAPLLTSSSYYYYSNFWGAMTDNFWYRRSKDYIQIQKRKSLGCFEVKLVRDCVLIDMSEKTVEKLTFNRTRLGMLKVRSLDNWVIFALSVSKAGLKNIVCNDELYGFISNKQLFTDSNSEEFLKFKLMMIRFGTCLNTTEYLTKYLPDKKPDKAGLDEIYYLNLKRRPEKKNYMEIMLAEHNLSGTIWESVDGKNLNFTELASKDIKVIDDWADHVYWRKPFSKGEMGCFLSHYTLWEEIIEKEHNRVMIFEDDAFLYHNFSRVLNRTLQQIDDSYMDWDFIFLGRVKFHDGLNETKVPGVENLYDASYSFLLVGYLLSLSGAVKLIEGKPLDKIIPVDVYVPLMFDAGVQFSWAQKYFPVKNLRAFALDPMIVEPRYQAFNEGFYSSDTDPLYGGN